MRTERLDVCEVCGEARLLRVGGERDLVRCHRCGYVCHTPRPTEAEIADFYASPEKYAGWLSAPRGRDLLWRSRLKVVRRLRRHGRLLDVGAGVGSFLRLARAHYDVCGTEVSPEAIRVAAEHANVALVHTAVEQLDLPAASFDVITMFHVLEHVHHPARTIERCRALLKPGGLLVVAVPNDVQGLRFRVRRLAARLGLSRRPRWFGPIDLDAANTDEVHLSHFTAPVLRRLLRRCGFRAIRDTLDRHYVSTGWRRIADDLYYVACRAARRLGLRLYDTMLLTAERPVATGKVA